MYIWSLCVEDAYVDEVIYHLPYFSLEMSDWSAEGYAILVILCFSSGYNLRSEPGWDRLAEGTLNYAATM